MLLYHFINCQPLNSWGTQTEREAWFLICSAIYQTFNGQKLPLSSTIELPLSSSLDVSFSGQLVRWSQRFSPSHKLGARIQSQREKEIGFPFHKTIKRRNILFSANFSFGILCNCNHDLNCASNFLLLFKLKIRLWFSF